jgi:hypothetical protein
MPRPSKATEAKRRRERSRQEAQEEKRANRALRSELKKERDLNRADGVDPDLVGIVAGPQPPRED